MQAAIGYLRVSTREQGRSGPGDWRRSGLRLRPSRRAKGSRLRLGIKISRPVVERMLCSCVRD